MLVSAHLGCSHTECLQISQVPSGPQTDLIPVRCPVHPTAISICHKQLIICKVQVHTGSGLTITCTKALLYPQRSHGKSFASIPVDTMNEKCEFSSLLVNLMATVSLLDNYSISGPWKPGWYRSAQQAAKRRFVLRTSQLQDGT